MPLSRRHPTICSASGRHEAFADLRELDVPYRHGLVTTQRLLAKRRESPDASCERMSPPWVYQSPAGSQAGACRSRQTKNANSRMPTKLWEVVKPKPYPSLEGFKPSSRTLAMMSAARMPIRETLVDVSLSKSSTVPDFLTLFIGDRTRLSRRTLLDPEDHLRYRAGGSLRRDERMSDHDLLIVLASFSHNVFSVERRRLRSRSSRNCQSQRSPLWITAEQGFFANTASILRSVLSKVPFDHDGRTSFQPDFHGLWGRWGYRSRGSQGYRT